MRAFRWMVTVVGVLALSPAVLACSTCTTAIADAVLPPILLWAALGPLWALLTACIGAWHRERVPGHFGIVMTMLLLVATLVAAAAGGGLAFFLLFLLPPARSYAIALWGPPDRFPSPTLRRDVRRLGAFAIVAIGAATLATVYVHKTRTEGEFILQWSSSGVAHSLTRNLRNHAASIETARHVVDHGGSTLATSAASAVGEHGDRSDVERLENVLDRARREGWPYPEDLRAPIARLNERLETGEVEPHD